MTLWKFGAPVANIIPLPYWQSVAPFFCGNSAWLFNTFEFINLAIPKQEEVKKTPTGPRRHPHNVPKWARFGETILWPRVAKQREGGITRRRKFLSTSGRTVRDHWRPRPDFFRHVYFTVKGDFISFVCLYLNSLLLFMATEPARPFRPERLRVRWERGAPSEENYTFSVIGTRNQRINWSYSVTFTFGFTWKWSFDFDSRVLLLTCTLDIHCWLGFLT